MDLPEARPREGDVARLGETANCHLPLLSPSTDRRSILLDLLIELSARQSSTTLPLPIATPPWPMVSFLRSPLAASFPSLPPPQAGDSRPTYDVGYTAVAHPPRRPFSLPLPTLDGRPVLEVKDVRWVRLCSAPLVLGARSYLAQAPLSTGWD